MAKVGIVMGSDSDIGQMSKAADILEEFGIEYEMEIISAHREPDELIEWCRGAWDSGIKVIIAGAGMAAALPGMCAALFDGPCDRGTAQRKVLDGTGFPILYAADASRSTCCHSGHRRSKECGNTCCTDTVCRIR